MWHYTDASVVNNHFLASTDNEMLSIGIIIGVIALVVLFALQIFVLLRFRKTTKEYCGMTFIEAEAD
ncbi:MAG TPA: hypothetical protein DCW47_02325 [Lachnospiraceae bacterium]|nr:hypothetical protein [Lachnospiraceae bacterium]